MCAGDTAGLTGDLYYYRGREGSCHDVKDKIVLFDTNVGYWTYKTAIPTVPNSHFFALSFAVMYGFKSSVPGIVHAFV